MTPFQLANALIPYATIDNGFGGRTPIPQVAPVRDALLAGRTPAIMDLAVCLTYLRRLAERASHSSITQQAHLALVTQALERFQD